MTYTVWRDLRGHCSCTVSDPRLGKGEHPVRHVKFYSPSRIETGYGGAGPADLALSILAHFFSESPTQKQLRAGACLCWQWHQNFKWKFIAPMTLKPGESYTIEAEAIAAWLKIEELALTSGLDKVKA